MVEAGIPAHRADARRVKAFIRSHGTLAKTDRIDAAALARYGLEPRRPPPLEGARRAARQSARPGAGPPGRGRGPYSLFQPPRRPGSAAARPYLEAILQTLEIQIKAIEKHLKAVIRGHEKLRKAVKVLCSIKGIGVITAVNLLALLPELGTLNRRQIASLGGLAPHPIQSGNTDRYRFVKGGRRDVKSVLFMAALSASQHNQTLRVFYQRLLAKGKLKLVALTAVMRKLLIICNAVLRQAAVAA
jgi:transposase